MWELAFKAYRRAWRVGAWWALPSRRVGRG